MFSNATLTILAVVTVGMLPYGLTLSTKLRGFDNQATRQWQTSLQGWRKRAYWAHLNGFEAFPFFAAAVVVNLVHADASNIVAGNNVASNNVVLLAWTFVAARIGYSLAYIFDKATTRSVVWFVGLFCVLGLFWQAI